MIPLKLRLSWSDPQNWAYLLGVYRFGNTYTLCLILVNVSVQW